MADHPSRLGRGLGALLAPRPAPTDGRTAESAGLEGPESDGAAVRRHSQDPGSWSTAVPAPSSAAAIVDGAAYREVAIGSLKPNARQPRTDFDLDALAELAASITQVGILQPIVVREDPAGGYEIVMGERRWRAAMAAGLETVPVLVRDTAPDALLRDALLENLHRADLNPLDEAAAYGQLLADFGATHEQLASRLGRSRAHVSNTLRLLQLPPAVQRRLAAGVLSAGHARALLSLSDPTAAELLAARVVAEGLSVRAVEELVAVGYDNPAKRERRRRAPRREFADLAAALSERWETRVRVQAGRTKGQLIVEFGSAADLDRILTMAAPDVRFASGVDSEPEINAAEPGAPTAGTWPGTARSD